MLECEMDYQGLMKQKTAIMYLQKEMHFVPTCTIPEASLRLRKVRPPWILCKATQPHNLTRLPTSVTPKSPQFAVLFTQFNAESLTGASGSWRASTVVEVEVVVQEGTKDGDRGTRGARDKDFKRVIRERRGERRKRGEARRSDPAIVVCLWKERRREWGFSPCAIVSVHSSRVDLVLI